MKSQRVPGEGRTGVDKKLPGLEANTPPSPNKLPPLPLKKGLISFNKAMELASNVGENIPGDNPGNPDGTGDRIPFKLGNRSSPSIPNRSPISSPGEISTVCSALSMVANFAAGDTAPVGDGPVRRCTRDMNSLGSMWITFGDTA